MDSQRRHRFMFIACDKLCSFEKHLHNSVLKRSDTVMRRRGKPIDSYLYFRHRSKAHRKSQWLLLSIWHSITSKLYKESSSCFFLTGSIKSQNKNAFILLTAIRVLRLIFLTRRVYYAFFFFFFFYNHLPQCNVCNLQEETNMFHKKRPAGLPDGGLVKLDQRQSNQTKQNLTSHLSFRVPKNYINRRWEGDFQRCVALLVEN